MAIGQNRVIHRFIRPIADYEADGTYFNQVIPVDTQAYAYYPNGERELTNLWYVFGDGIHTYTEIRDGKGTTEGAKEYPVFTADIIQIIENFDNTYAKKEDVYTKEEVDNLIADVPTFDILVVEELPITGKPHILYLTPGDESTEEDNWYYEYLWIDNRWELIGNTKGGGVDPEDMKADKIQYDYGSIKTVQEALDLLMSFKPDIEPGEDEIVEEGSTVKDVTLSWEINKPLVSITIQPGDISVDPTATSYTIKNANITETTTYTITMNDGKNDYTTEQSVIFAQKLYNGTSANTTVDNTQILDFDQYFETTETEGTCNFNCTDGKYFFICIPAEKADKVTFKINGFTFTDMIRTDVELINASGYTSTYSIFRCNNLQHAQSINVEYFYNE